MTQFHDVRQEHVVLSLCVHLSCFAQQVALFRRELAQHGCFQTDYQVSLLDLKNQASSLRKPFSSISWEREVSPLTTNTFSVLSSFTDRSQIGLGFDWVSWENVAR